MTDTPLTRAARALMLSQSGVDDFDALDDEMQAQVLKDVRAVLEAVREPSERMISDGESAASYGIGKPVDDEALPRVWQAMIDAAISRG